MPTVVSQGKQQQSNEAVILDFWVSNLLMFYQQDPHNHFHGCSAPDLTSFPLRPHMQSQSTTYSPEFHLLRSSGLFLFFYVLVFHLSFPIESDLQTSLSLPSLGEFHYFMFFRNTLLPVNSPWLYRPQRFLILWIYILCPFFLFYLLDFIFDF